MPAAREMASALPSAYPRCANTAAAASSRRWRCTPTRTSRGGAWRPRGTRGGERWPVTAMHHIVGTLGGGMPRSLIAAALAATVALAGCAGAPSSGSSSTSKFTGDQKLVANTIEDLETASRPGRSDTGKVCRDIVTPALAKQRASGGRTTCEKAVDSAIKDADAYQLTVQKVVINGTADVAQVKTETGKQDRIQSIGLQKAPPAQGWR